MCKGIYLKLNLSPDGGRGGDGMGSDSETKDAGTQDTTKGPRTINGVETEMDARRKAVKEELLMRLRTIRGHVAGIERMVEEGKECSEVLVQLSAIKAAVNKVEAYFLENYARECMARCLQRGGDVMQEMERIVQAVLKFLH